MEKAEVIRSSFFIKRDADNQLMCWRKSEKIGGNQSRVSGTAENAEAYKSDSVHPLNKSGSGKFCPGPF